MTSFATPMVWLNGRLLPASEATLPISDRAILYGDSLFETIPIRGGRVVQWQAHLDRLQAGERTTGIESGLDVPGWTLALQALLEANQATHGVVRLTVTRGSGVRGYSPRKSGPPNRILTWHPSAPLIEPHAGWHLRTSRFQVLADDPLANAKHGSRLVNVLARSEAEAAGADDALLLNTRGEVAETSTGNIFWIRGGAVCQPPAGSGALAGITARIIQRAVRSNGWSLREESISPSLLQDAAGAFVSLSSLGVVPILSIDGTPMPPHAWITRLATEFVAGMDLIPL